MAESPDKIPKELLSFKILINPTRLAIMAILYANYKAPASQVRKILGIPWGTFNSHIRKLIDAGYISARREFVGENPAIILYLEQQGEVDFRKFSSIWKKLSE